MSRKPEDTYWERRGKNGYAYRGDRFYTKTPIALYCRRRQRLLTEREALLDDLPDGARVLDFGCGDGFYSVHFAKTFPRLRFFGCDIAASMIEHARHRAEERGADCRCEHTDGPIPFDEDFDLILVVAVFAHIMEPDVRGRIIEDMHDRLEPGGRVVIFEQTGRTAHRGRTWQRLRPETYRRLFEDAGFKLRREILIAFPFYNFFGKALSGLSLCFGGPLRANANRLYQWVTEKFMSLGDFFGRSLPRWRGNTVFVFEKPGPG